MKLIASIAAGGALGAIGRYFLMDRLGHWLGHGFPYGTLAVNVAGAFLLGALIEIMALYWSPSQDMRAFLVVGVLGSFTTFSAFSLDVVALMTRGNLSAAGIYILASMFVTVTALLAGMTLFRQVLS